jgi:predicted kinase
MSYEDIGKMKALRKSDPDNWTVSKLAKEFKCTAAFVQLMAPLNPCQRKKKQEARRAEHERQRTWGERKSLVRAIRQKRRELW